MTPLDELSVKAPRPAALYGRYARRLDPWWGFVIAAWVWATGALVVQVLALIAILRAFGLRDGSPGARVVALVLFLAVGALTIASFRWWRRHRLASKAALIRDGELVEVQVTARPFEAFGWKSRTALELVGANRRLRCVFNRWFLPTVGQPIMLLHHRALAHVVAFGPSGAMYAGHVVDGDAPGAVDLPVARVHRR